MSSAIKRWSAKKGAVVCALLLALMLLQSGGVERATGQRVIENASPGRPAARPCCLLARKQVFPWVLFPWVDPLLDPSDKLAHRYGAGTWSYLRRAEVNGLAYTCSVGFIDLGHIRHVADLTYYYYGRLREATRPGAGLRTVGHGGFVEITRPLPAADPNARLQVARSLAFDESIFYEIETYWSKLLGQHHSAFSPEDLVSNLVGTYVGEQAVEHMKAEAIGFDTAVTRVLATTLRRFGTLSAGQTRAALAEVDDAWFAGSPQSLNYLRRRNFGYDPVTPWRLKGEEGCADHTPFLEPVRPLPQHLRDFYAVNYKIPRIYSNAVLRRLLEISPGFGVPPGRKDDVYVNREDFADHVARIKAHAGTTYGPRFDKP